MLLVLILFAGLVSLIQVVYLGRYLYAFRHRQSGETTNTPPVSVVVCAHDEEANLRELLPLLLTQDYPDFEVIVVEDRCNDGTYDYLLEATRVHPQLRMVRVKYLPEHVTGKKYALTLGVKAATHEWVLLTDADCRPVGQQWIRSMAGGMTADKEIVLGYSPYERKPGFLNTFIRFESLITATQFVGRALLGTPYMGTGRNLAYRKALFLNNKGFHDHLGVTGGDDDLFVNRHASRDNTSVCLGEASLMRSLPETTWSNFLHQKKRHLSVGKYYRWRDRWTLGVFTLTWIFSWMLLPCTLLPETVGYGAWTGFLARSFLLTWLVHRASRRMGEPFEAWKTPLLDFNYAIYYLGTGLSALVSKRIRWKN